MDSFITNIQNSPIEKIIFEKHSFFIKRDDLLHQDFNGNKARKFHYFLEHNFPNIKKVISYGSNQSNAMYSLSVLCRLKKWEFIYHTKHISSFLSSNPIGNYKEALQNGMKIVVGDFDDSLFCDDDSTLVVKEGGAIKKSAYGIKILASEISQYIQKHNLQNIKIFLPSGTGTTALFLQKYLSCEVLTCACVGDDKYLKKQFLQLEKDKSLHPTILKTSKKFHFGKLYKENYQIWQKLKQQTNIEFDLLYDAIGWQTLLMQTKLINSNNIIYIHQGGVKGNITMIQRYTRNIKLSSK
jgi:1-aminocyclopropane-1-carboxylate deaminase/D-cysteine desulfhydrase-like pyridoxal-dependent ACC family enzyme